MQSLMQRELWLLVLAAHLGVLRLVFVLVELEQDLVLLQVLLEVQLAEVLELPYMKHYKTLLTTFYCYGSQMR